MNPDKQLISLITRGPRTQAAEAAAPLRRKTIADFILCVVPKLDRESRTSAGSNILAPTMYEISGGDKDKLFLGQVVDTGPGVTINGQKESMCVAKGDVLLCNLSNLSYRKTERGLKQYLLRNGIVLAVLGKDFSVMPVRDSILVRNGSAPSLAIPGKTVEQRALEHMRGDGRIWLPTEAMETDDEREHKRYSSAIVAEYGEVISVGPGCWHEGNWHAPACKPGDLILYDASYGTLPVTIKGEQYTLVPSRMHVETADAV